MRAIFDCDGVLFDSNALKVEAFRATLAPRFGQPVVAEFIEHHKAHGGVSRYVKFARLAEAVAPSEQRAALVEELLTEFSRACVRLYAECQLTAGALECLDWLAPQAKLFVASGSDEAELRLVLEARGLAARFAGIYGSPTPKEALVRRLAAELAPGERAFFVGDAVKDFEAARAGGIPCVLMDGYSDAAPALWQLAQEFQVPLIRDLRELRALVEAGSLWW
jgi:HAD superfamily hydrolase (TIGR01549 family)